MKKAAASHATTRVHAAADQEPRHIDEPGCEQLDDTEPPASVDVALDELAPASPDCRLRKSLARADRETPRSRRALFHQMGEVPVFFRKGVY